MQENEPPRRRDGRVRFFRHMDEIRQKMDEGYSLKAIYDGLAESLGFQYLQFARYVARYLKDSTSHVEHKKPAAPRAQEKQPVRIQRQENKAPGKESNPEPKQPGTVPFVHDPKTIDPDDMY